MDAKPAPPHVVAVVVQYSDGTTESIDSHRHGRVERTVYEHPHFPGEVVERVQVVLIRDKHAKLPVMVTAPPLDPMSYDPDPPTPPGVHRT